MDKINVLLLEAEGSQGIAIAKELYQKGYVIHGFFNDKNSYGYHSKYIKYKSYLPFKTDNDYKDAIIIYVKIYKTDVIIPLSDDSARTLSIYREELLSYSKFISPCFDVFKKGYDKNSLMKICRENNIAHPATIDLSLTNGRIPQEFIFPAIIKPNITTGARGMVVVNDIEEFESIYPAVKDKYGDCHIQYFIPEGGRQIESQFFLDSSGNILMYSLLYKSRFYPVKAGSSSCSISIERRADIIEQCSKLLKQLNWVGFASFDMIEDPSDGLVKITELNPRIPANIRTVIKSGASFGDLIVNFCLNGKINQYTYKSGIILRHLGFDVLWFIKAGSRFTTKPNWFSFFGKNIYYQDFDIYDPLSFIMGTYGNIRKLMSREFRMSKNTNS